MPSPFFMFIPKIGYYVLPEKRVSFCCVRTCLFPSSTCYCIVKMDDIQQRGLSSPSLALALRLVTKGKQLESATFKIGSGYFTSVFGLESPSRRLESSVHC